MEEMNHLFDKQGDMKRELIADQEFTLKLQDERMTVRVEQRLTEIQVEFLKKTEAAAQAIFDENHKKVNETLAVSNARVDGVVDYHKT